MAIHAVQPLIVFQKNIAMIFTKFCVCCFLTHASHSSETVLQHGCESEWVGLLERLCTLVLKG